MRSISTLLAAHIAGEVTTLAVCWVVTRTDGYAIRGTENDRDIAISVNTTDMDLVGVYSASAGITGSDIRSTDDMSVDNMEVKGAVANPGDLVILDMSAAEIEAGLFDAAGLTVFLVNWAAPDEGQMILRTGTIGEISRSSDREYSTEVRGLAQQLAQMVVRTYSPSCDAELGDDRCKVDISAITVTGTVTAAASPREFTALIDGGSNAVPNDYYDGGEVEWTAGQNKDFSMEIKRRVEGSPDSEVTLFLPMPADIQVGDTFSCRPGCNKSFAMCKIRYNNVNNYRGHGTWVPGIGEMSAFGGQTAEKKPKSSGFLEPGYTA